MHTENVEDIYPLSPLQQGMLFHALASPRKGVYFQEATCVLEGDLDRQALETAWQRVADRHPVLRTAFIHEQIEQAVQVVCRRVDVPFEFQDLRGLSDSEQRRHIDDFLAANRSRGFRLADAPLMRVALLRTAADRHILVWSHHHLVLDGWSVGLVLQELFALYAAAVTGKQPALAPAAPFRNYIAWLKRQDSALSEAFWRRELAGFHTATRLGLDRDPAGRFKLEAEGAQAEVRLSKAATERLQAFARQQHLTLNTLVQGAWALLLSRHSGEEDVVFGVVSAGRPPALPQVDRMVGLFINTIPARVRASAKAPLLPWLRDLQLRQAEARQHEHTPLQQVRAWSDVPQGEPLFESIIDFASYPEEASAPSSGVLRVRDFHLSERTSYALALVAAPGERLLLRLYYDARRFDAPAVRRLLAQLENLLEEMTAHPGRCLGELELLPEFERRQILGWGAEAFEIPEASGVLHELFAEQVTRTPDAPAVICEGEQLTYRELDCRSGRLARRLRALGAGPESLVGICLERSLELVVALLGVLKAGAAYVPLDPRYPRQRLAWLVEDTAMEIVVTREALAPSLPQGGFTTLCLDAAAEISAAAPDAEPKVEVHPANAAYVIYTSGSTGRPKGVVVTHANVVRLFRATERWFGFGERDVWTLFHSYAFDFSVWEVWGALLHGGRLVVVPFDTSRSPMVFHELLRRERVTILNQTPSAFYPLIEADLAAEARDLALRLVIFGGEALDFQRLQPWFERHGEDQPRLVNMYGITETTVHVTYRPVGKAEAGAAGSAIGRRIPDLEIYLLDRQGRMAPLGCPGEIHVGGAGLARGYLNRPDLAAERFTPNPFAAHPGARLYRTGDLARLQPDGDLEYLGRIDSQVKIRGFRIELGEIEAALAGHPEVRETVVTARQDDAADVRLAAYFVPRHQVLPTAAELRRFLEGTLPEHMLPAFFVALAALPLTPSGKVDRLSLPEPERDRNEDGRPYVAPRTRVEALLAEAWEAVLRVERVGIHDDYFELGGDSILSIQILSRLRRAGLDLNSAEFFQYPTIAELAAIVGVRQATSAEQGPVTGPVPLTPIQHWFFEQEPCEPHHFNQALLLEVDRRLAPGRWARIVARLLEHHDALRLRFARSESGWRQWHEAPERTVPFACVDLSQLSFAERFGALERAASAIQASLDLTAGPLLRTALFQLGEGEPDRLLLVVHHLGIDAVSWRILLQDLWEVFDGLLRGEDVSLPAKTTSFQDWALQLDRHARSHELATQKAYWSTIGRVRAPALPVAAGGETAGSARTLTAELDPVATRSLLQDVPEVYHTRINDVLLTALVEALAGLTGLRRLLLDLEGHGREALFEEVDLSRTVGWFTTVFPVLLDLEGTVEPGATLKSVKEQLRAIPGRGLGYGVLRYLAGDGELAALPRAEVSFNYLGQLDRALPEGHAFRPARESVGPVRSPRQRLRYRLDVVAQVAGGRLQTSWTCDGSLPPAALESLAQRFLAALRSLIEHCGSPLAGGYTCSDFPQARLDQQQLDALVAEYGGPRARIEDIYPLTPMQSGMLFHGLYGPGSGLYVQHLLCTLEGDLDTGAFVEAWRSLLARHPILRTSFVWKGLDEPHQVVAAAADLPMERVDWRYVPGEEVERRISALLEDDRRRGFDLARAPLLRLFLARTGERTHRLVWTHHHILLDGWSRARLIHQLVSSYRAARRGQEVEPIAVTPFRTYVEWLRRQEPAEAREFWLRQLAGFTAAEVFADRNAAPGGEPHGQEEIALTASATTGLQALARGHQITLSVLLQGAWALLLSRYSGREDILFGLIVSGRNGSLQGIETVVGLLMNIQPVRARVRPDQRLLPWLKDLQERQAQALRYEHVPLTTIQSWLGVGARALFDTIFVFENFPVQDSSSERQRAELEIRRPRGEGAVSYPLALVVEPESELLLRIRYDARFFEAATVRRMLESYGALVESILEDPVRELGELAAGTALPLESLQSFNEVLEF